MINRNLINILLFFFIISFISCSTIKKNITQKKDFSEIVKIAQKELSQILNKIPNGEEKLYGFNNAEEIANVKINNPIEFYKIENEELKTTSSYRVPITVADEFRALATIEYINDTPHIVDFGANILAKEIQTVCKENSKMNFVGILRIYDMYSDFIIMSKKQNYFFIPLTSAKMYLKSIGISNPDNYYSKSQVLSFIKNK